jgi:hypothetical protein
VTTMAMDYTGARIGQTCSYCGGRVRVTSAKRLIKRALAGNNRKTRVCVECDCSSAFRKPTKRERDDLIRRAKILVQ